MWRYLALRKFGIVFAETLFLTGWILVGHLIYFGQIWPPAPNYSAILVKAFLIAIIFQLVMHLNDIYGFQGARLSRTFVIRIFQSLVIAWCILAVLFKVVPHGDLSRTGLIYGMILCSVFLMLWHTMLRLYMRVRTPHTNLLVLGTGNLAREAVSEILRHPELGIKVVGFVDDNPGLVGVSIVNPRVIGGYQDLARLVRVHRVDWIVVGLQDRRGKLPIKELLDFKTRGITIEDATTFYERVAGKIPIENLKPSWLIFNSGFAVSKSMLAKKRIFSIAFSFFLLLALSPLLLLVMIAIKLDSRGPIFYRQERVGRILRRTRIDELPQFYNVLRGDMSLVGPRPERPMFVEQLSEEIPYYPLRHVIKPGITGWAQINYGYANTLEHTVEKLQYDLFYIKNISWILDLLIVFETVKTVMVKSGS
jgi:lipopolysaccharide/colanic/teichoic acid biosynthesis glycosyltransferase